MNQAEVQKIIGGPPAKPATGLFLPDSPYYSNTHYPTFDPAGAKELVSAYKAKHGTPTLNLLTIPDPLEIKVVQAVQQMWQQVGFDVTVSEVRAGDRSSTTSSSGSFQAVTSYQFGAVNPDLNYVWWSTTTISPIGTIGLNFTRMDDPTIESAMLEGRHTTSQATRQTAYRTVNEQLAKQLPVPVDRAVPLLGGGGRAGPELQQSDPAQRHARVQLRRRRLLPRADLAHPTSRSGNRSERLDTPMGKYFLRRSVQLVVVAFIISVLTFLLVHLLPGDPSVVILGPNDNAHNRAVLFKQLGPQQAALPAVLHLAGGRVPRQPGPVLPRPRVGDPHHRHRLAHRPRADHHLPGHRLRRGHPAGPGHLPAAQPARRQRGHHRHVRACWPCRPFVIAPIMVAVFAVGLHWFPATGYVPFTQDPATNLHDMILPSLAITAGSIAVYYRLFRSDLISTLQEDFITMARSKGMSSRWIMWRHAFRPSSFSLLAAAGGQHRGPHRRDLHRRVPVRHQRARGTPWSRPCSSGTTWWSRASRWSSPSPTWCSSSSSTSCSRWSIRG